MSISFDGQVAIITGAGAGLGRVHALELAERGAHVVISDIAPAGTVVREITDSGGSAQDLPTDITDRVAAADLVARVLDEHRRVDILVNNAGILRDRSFAKMTFDEFREVVDVHLYGAFHLTHAVWSPMREQRYGRILFTTSPSGLFGNFGQANYASAKMALVGFMHSLAIEGAKYGIRVNALAPLATTGMTVNLLPEEARERMSPQTVSPGAAVLVGEDSPNGVILSAAGGRFSLVKVLEGSGLQIASPNAEEIQAKWHQICDMEKASGFASLQEHLAHVVASPGAS